MSTSRKLVVPYAPLAPPFFHPLLVEQIGKSGRDMLDALLAGISDAETLPSLREALEGRVEATHRILLRHLLDRFDGLQAEIEQLGSDSVPFLEPYQKQITLLMQITGVGHLAAMAILAEIGIDMGRFPSHKHLASWAGLAPGNKQSGGKRLHASTTRGSTHLRAVLAEVVWVISRTKDNYLSAQYHRLARRIGKKRAIVAVSHSLIVIIYHMLRDDLDYHDLGSDFFVQLDATRQRDLAMHHLQALGYTVTLEVAKEVSA